MAKNISVELLFHLAFWIFYFSAINVQWTANWFDPQLRPQSPPPLSVLLFPLLFYLNAEWLIPVFLKKSSWGMYFIYLGLVFASFEISRLLFYYFLHRSEEPLLVQGMKEIWSRDSFLFGSPSPIVYALFTSYAYRFAKDWLLNQRKIERLEALQVRRELDLLKQQMNPHFLFNNLNTLDDLIEQDPARAKIYLHKLGRIYQYYLTSSEQDLVSLAEEWQFMEDYIYLLDVRFGSAYQFESQFDKDKVETFFIPPATLQSLVENIIKHNRAGVEKPLISRIYLSADKLIICHPRRPKANPTSESGRGLSNLNSRLQLLGGEKISIREDESFEVQIPLIKAQK